jgi:hypothetical protein
MNIQLNRVITFNLVIDGADLGAFEKEDSWNGMTSLINASGEKIILQGTPGKLSDKILALDLEASDQYTVIAASPNLQAKIPAQVKGHHKYFKVLEAIAMAEGLSEAKAIAREALI